MKRLIIPSLLLAAAPLLVSGRQLTGYGRDLSPRTATPENASVLLGSEGSSSGLDAARPSFRVLEIPQVLPVPGVGEPVTLQSLLMNRNDSLYMITWGTNVGQAEYINRVGDVIVASDGAFYLKDPIIGQRIGTWLKGELKDGVVSFALPQAIAYAQFEDGSTSKLLANVVVRDSNTYRPVTGDTVVRFSWDGDTLRSIDPAVRIGMVVERDGSWTGYADWNQCWQVQRDTPASYSGYADAADYSLGYYDYNFLYNQTLACETKVRIDGDQVLVSEIPSTPAGAVVKGRLDGDIVSFPKQYLGIDSVNMCHVYFQPLYQHLRLEGYDLYVDERCTETYAMTLCRDSMTFHAADDNAFSINCGKDVHLTIDSRGMAHNARLKPFDRNRPATPATGQVYMYSNANPSWGFACFAHSMMDTEGVYLDQDKLYWSLYLNDTIQELDTSVYTGLEGEKATEVPFSLNNGTNLFAFNYNYMHQVSTFRAWDKLGIQVIYKAGGEVRRSDIFNSDQTVTPAAVAAVGTDDRTPVRSVYHDLYGRLVANPDRGIYIRTDYFDDGTARSVKTVR